MTYIHAGNVFQEILAVEREHLFNSAFGMISCTNGTHNFVGRVFIKELNEYCNNYMCKSLLMVDP